VDKSAAVCTVSGDLVAVSRAVAMIKDVLAANQSSEMSIEEGREKFNVMYIFRCA
jgi:hypothetical protein